MSVITEHIQDLAAKLSACLAQAGPAVVRVPRQREPDDGQVTRKIRPIRGRDVRQVLGIERQAFPDDPWTPESVNGWLARATRGGRARHATRLAGFIRFVRLNQAGSFVRLIRLLALNQPPGLRYVVAEADGGEIAGFACLSTAGGAEARIPVIAVRPDRQGQKIGTELLTELTAMAAAGGCRDISLYVRADNSRGHRLYRRTGFTEVAVQPGFYQPSGTDAVMMRLSVPKARTLSEKSPGNQTGCFQGGTDKHPGATHEIPSRTGCRHGGRIHRWM
jgi:ribosomal protein S18 acetylase RimI-like enzyme